MSTSLTILEIVQLIDELNTKAYESSQEETSVAFDPFVFKTNGSLWWIEFLGLPIADSDNQGFPLGINELKAYLIDEADKHLEGLRKIKLS